MASSTTRRRKVLVDANMPSVETAIRKCRLKCFSRFVRQAPPPLARLVLLTLGVQGSWIEEVRADFIFLWRYPEGKKILPSPVVNFWQWFDALSTGDASVLNLLLKANVVMGMPSLLDVSLVDDQVPPAEHPCYECGKCFPSATSLLSHAAHAHGYVNPLRARLCTTHCVACGVEFLSMDSDGASAPSRCCEQLRDKIP